MSVDRDEVRRIADLAKLSLDDVETERLTDEMNRILAHAERLGSVAAEGLDPEGRDLTAGATSEGSARQASGPDTLAHPVSDFAPELHEGFFTVPPPPGVIDFGS